MLIINIYKATNTVPMKQRPRIINHETIMNFQLVGNEKGNMFISKTILTAGLNHCYMHYKHL